MPKTRVTVPQQVRAGVRGEAGCEGDVQAARDRAPVLAFCAPDYEPGQLEAAAEQDQGELTASEPDYARQDSSDEAVAWVFLGKGFFLEQRG